MFRPRFPDIFDNLPPLLRIVRIVIVYSSAHEIQREGNSRQQIVEREERASVVNLEERTAGPLQIASSSEDIDFSNSTLN